jgi:hypothetical protein
LVVRIGAKRITKVIVGFASTYVIASHLVHVQRLVRFVDSYNDTIAHDIVHRSIRVKAAQREVLNLIAWNYGVPRHGVLPIRSRPTGDFLTMLFSLYIVHYTTLIVLRVARSSAMT